METVLCCHDKSQCNFDTVDDDDFEYNTNIDGLISGTVYHLTPKDIKAAHSPTRYCYMNFVNGLSSNTMVFNRSYNVCLNHTYRFSAWFNEINGGSSNYVLRVKDSNDSTLFTTSQSNSTVSWVQWTSSSFTASTATIKFQLIYTGGTGNNDLAMDDLVLERCQIDPYENDSITVCISNTVNLIDSIVYPGGTGGMWSGPSILLNDSLGTFKARNMVAGQYSYTLSTNAACPDSIGTIDVGILSVDTSVSLNNFQLTAGASNSSFQWIDCSNGQAIVGETGSTFSPLANGSYAVEVTQNGCSDTSACMPVQGIGVEEQNELELHIFPNPSTASFELHFGRSHDRIAVRILDLTGQLVRELHFERSKEVIVDLSGMAKQLYILQIETERSVHTEMIILTD